MQKARQVALQYIFLDEHLKVRCGAELFAVNDEFCEVSYLLNDVYVIELCQELHISEPQDEFFHFGLGIDGLHL